MPFAAVFLVVFVSYLPFWQKGPLAFETQWLSENLRHFVLAPWQRLWVPIQGAPRPLMWLLWATYSQVSLSVLNKVASLGLFFSFIFLCQLTLRSFLERWDPKWYRAHFNPAAWATSAATAILCLNPVLVEGVVSVRAQPFLWQWNLMLLSLLSYLRTMQSVRSHGYFFFSIFLFLAALGFGPEAAAFPLLLVLLDHYPLGRLGENWFGPLAKTAWWEKIPYVAGSLIALLCYWVRGPVLMPLGWKDKLLFLGSNWVVTLWAFLWPFATFSPRYFLGASRAINQPEIGFPVFAVVVFSILWFVLRKWWPWVWNCWLGFLVFVLAGAVWTDSNTAFSDSRAIFAVVPLAAILMGPLMALLLWAQSTVQRVRSVAVTAVVLCALLGGATWRQQTLWQSDSSYWGYLLEHGGENDSQVLLRLADIAVADHSFIEAYSLYERILSRSPNSLEARYGIARVAFEASEWDKMDEALASVFSLSTFHVPSLKLKAMKLLLDLKYDEAMKILKDLVELDEKDEELHFLLAEAYFELQDYPMTKYHVGRTLSLNPQHRLAKDLLDEVEAADSSTANSSSQ